MATTIASPAVGGGDERRTKVLNDYRSRLLEHRQLEEKLKQSTIYCCNFDHSV
jgi:hypothetical protein